MKSTVLILLMLLCSSAGIVQERLPIIDIPLHIYSVGHFWPAGAPHPATGNPSSETDEKLFLQTRATMDRYNIVLAVLGRYPYDVVLDWKNEDPERITPSQYLSLAEELDIPDGVHLGPSPPRATYVCCPDFRAVNTKPLLIEKEIA